MSVPCVKTTAVPSPRSTTVRSIAMVRLVDSRMD
jgi:hypothetical protein